MGGLLMMPVAETLSRVSIPVSRSYIWLRSSAGRMRKPANVDGVVDGVVDMSEGEDRG